MFGLFRNFITAFEAKSKTDNAYDKRQKEIRDAIQKDIIDHAEIFKYSLNYDVYPGVYCFSSNISAYTKVKFIIEHKEEFESMGYNIFYRAYSYVSEDGQTYPVIIPTDRKINKVSKSYKEAEYIYLTISWANEEK